MMMVIIIIRLRNIEIDIYPIKRIRLKRINDILYHLLISNSIFGRIRYDLLTDFNSSGLIRSILVLETAKENNMFKPIKSLVSRQLIKISVDRIFSICHGELSETVTLLPVLK